MKIQHWLLLSIVLTELCACASNKNAVIPPQGDTIKTVYETHLNNLGVGDRDEARAALKHRPISAQQTDLDGYVRDAFNELDVHFPRLPNPSLVLYVFPHLSGRERVPVPGYATTFPLYTQVEYALAEDFQSQRPVSSSQE